MKILAYKVDDENSFGKYSCNDGRELVSKDWEEISGFLLKPCDFAVTWDIDRLFNIVSSTLPNEFVRDWLKEPSGRMYSYDNRKLYYKVNKKLGINYIDIFGLRKYSDEEPKTPQALLELANQVIEAFKYFGVEATKLTSPVAVYESVLRKVKFPVAGDLPDEAYGLLNVCDQKAWEEWREVYRLGHWNKEEVTDADLQSAYPSIIARLPDISNAKFFEADTMPDNEEFDWGEMQGELTITKDVTPFKYIGTWQDSITTAQKRLIDTFELGEFKFKHGWFLKLPPKYSFPFKQTMQNLYEARSNQNLMVSKIAKQISVGVGGKMAQKFDTGKLGEFYNAIYSRIITSQCQVMVAYQIWRNGVSKDVISVMVDGFLVENNGIKIDLGQKRGMGSWRVNEPSNFLVASLLYQWDGLNTKRPNGETYQQVMEHIKENPISPLIANDVDLNTLTYEREFFNRPKRGLDLLNGKFISTPIAKEAVCQNAGVELN